MAPDRWTRVKDALSLALRRPAEERAAVLDAVCGADAALRREVEDLLEAQGDMGRFLEEPLFPEAEAPAPPGGIPPELRDWSRYDILEPLGRGGMATVYKAWDPRLRRLAAIKVMAAGDDVAVLRFVHEAEAQARVEHDHVVKVFETGVVGPHHYIAMQYVDGPTLLEVRDETTLDQKVRLILQVAEGLHAAHRHGLIHRDIKPGNILVERGPDGLKPYLLDFGLAVELGAPGLTRPGVVVGTPKYMPPERIEGGTAALDRRSDIFSLGATCFEFVAGVAPFGDTAGLQVLARILDGEPVPLRRRVPSIPADLDAIVGKCLERDPQRRYASARALADDLRHYLDGEPVLARPAGRLARLTRRARRYPRLAATFATMILLTIGTATWAAYGSWRAARQAEVAQQLGQEVRDLDWLFRAAQMSPLHSIEAEKQRVRDRMGRVDQMMRRAGAIAAGAGAYALGRGSLILGDYEAALDHLTRAWEAGYRTSDAATALGLAHGETYRLEVRRAQRLLDDAARAARLSALEAAHRDRARQYLQAGRDSSLVPPRFAEALIAALGDDLPEAIARADEAARETPWLFEARLLPADLEFQEAVRHYGEGRAADAVRHAEAADRYYAEAARVAPSAVDARLGRCAVAGLFLHMAMHRVARDSGADLAAVEQACPAALTVEPSNPEGYRLYGEAIRFWGGIHVQRGTDPGDAYERATELVGRAMVLSDGDFDATMTLADTWLDRAWWESQTERDPRPALAEAIAIYEKVRELNPRSVPVFNQLGQALQLLSRVETARGLDATATQRHALETFKQGLRLDPRVAFTLRNLRSASLALAALQTRRGEDPAPALEETLAFLARLDGDPVQPDRVETVRRIEERLMAARAATVSVPPGRGSGAE